MEASGKARECNGRNRVSRDAKAAKGSSKAEERCDEVNADGKRWEVSVQGVKRAAEMRIVLFVERRRDRESANVIPRAQRVTNGVGSVRV